MNELTITLMPNTKENRAKLMTGYGYVVKFYDIDTENEAIAGAVWKGKKFKYFDGRFIHGCEPRLIIEQKIPPHNLVLEFARFVDWEA